jgi:hypothetical protein
MPDEMTCFACEQEPTQQCPRCGRPYCDDHGEDVCDACLEPASGLPSFTLYRGSLLALLIGTALAVWLILQPPGDTADSAVAPPPTEPAATQPTPTQPAGATGAQPDNTPSEGETPETTETPEATGPTGPTGSTGATGSAGDNTTTYTIQDGDTLFGLCSTLSTLDPSECLERLLDINGITLETTLTAGDTLVIPLR